jgi:hypothetical protein
MRILLQNHNHYRRSIFLSQSLGYFLFRGLGLLKVFNLRLFHTGSISPLHISSHFRLIRQLFVPGWPIWKRNPMEFKTKKN